MGIKPALKLFLNHSLEYRQNNNISAIAILSFCAQALFIQSAHSQCASRAAVAAAPGIAAPTLASPCGFGAPYGLVAPGLAAPALAAPCGIATPVLDYTPTSGGLLPISSASAIAPVGLAVASDNVYEGPRAVAGELPFVGTVGFEGVLPTAGTGVANHACGNGRNAMISADTAFGPGYAAAMAPATAIAPFGAITSTAAIAPGISTPAFAYGRGYGCAL